MGYFPNSYSTYRNSRYVEVLGHFANLRFHQSKQNCVRRKAELIIGLELSLLGGGSIATRLVDLLVKVSQIRSSKRLSK
jgi:hypothetical protein